MWFYCLNLKIRWRSNRRITLPSKGRRERELEVWVPTHCHPEKEHGCLGAWEVAAAGRNLTSMGAWRGDHLCQGITSWFWEWIRSAQHFAIKNTELRCWACWKSACIPCSAFCWSILVKQHKKANRTVSTFAVFFYSLNEIIMF